MKEAAYRPHAHGVEDENLSTDEIYGYVSKFVESHPIPKPDRYPSNLTTRLRSLLEEDTLQSPDRVSTKPFTFMKVKPFEFMKEEMKIICKRDKRDNESDDEYFNSIIECALNEYDH